jgi:hypothetical protein
VAVLRLMGLPSVARYARAVLSRGEDRILIHFGGDGPEREVDVPLRLLGPVDAEATELRLLARLTELGYEVRPSGALQR